MRRSATQAAAGSAAWGNLFVTAGAAQVACVLHRLARTTPGPRLRIQPQVGQDLLDYRSLEDGRDGRCAVRDRAASPTLPSFPTHERVMSLGAVLEDCVGEPSWSGNR